MKNKAYYYKVKYCKSGFADFFNPEKKVIETTKDVAIEECRKLKKSNKNLYQSTKVKVNEDVYYIDFEDSKKWQIVEGYLFNCESEQEAINHIEEIYYIRTKLTFRDFDFFIDTKNKSLVLDRKIYSLVKEGTCCNYSALGYRYYGVSDKMTNSNIYRELISINEWIIDFIYEPILFLFKNEFEGITAIFNGETLNFYWVDNDNIIRLDEFETIPLDEELTYKIIENEKNIHQIDFEY